MLKQPHICYESFNFHLPCQQLVKQRFLRDTCIWQRGTDNKRRGFVQEEQSALQSPASMDTDRRAEKAAEHSPSMQSVMQGKAVEEQPEEDAGQMHSAAQEQVAQELPEQVTGQQSLSAVQEQAEEWLPEQAAGLMPSVKAEALPEQSAWQTPSSAVQEQSGEALPEQPSEQTPAAAVAEAQSLSEQGGRATSSVAGEALPVQAIEQTPLTAAEAPLIGDTPSIPRQEHGTASIAPSEQPAGHVPPLTAAQEIPRRHSADRGAASISGTEQGTGKAPAMTVEEVDALGQELCAEVRALSYENHLHMPGHPTAVCLYLVPGLRKISACKVSWAEAWIEALFRVHFFRRSSENVQKLDALRQVQRLLACLDCVPPYRLLSTFQGHSRRPRRCVQQPEQCATCSSDSASRLRC